MGIAKTRRISSSAANVLQQRCNLRMHAARFISIIVCQLIWVAQSESGWLGTFPAPRDLTSDASIVAASWTNVTMGFDSYIAGTRGPDANGLADLKDFTFSVNLFSVHDAQAAGLLQYHNTGPDVANATAGVHKVNGDSAYRLGSLTKLFTALSGLLNLDCKDWDRPITDFVPGLRREFSDGTDQDFVNVAQWEKVTLRALAAQLGGGPGNAAPFILDQGLPGGSFVADPALFGLPPVNFSDPSVFPPCAYASNANATLNCPEGEWIQALRARAPVFLPWASPAYSNAGFILLGLAIANITGKPLADIAAESIFNPLGLASSSYVVPANLSTAVIPGVVDPFASGFAVQAGITTSSGGMFSSLNDLSNFGVAVLNSTLLPPEETRRWLKPVSHTASLTATVGAPWEIIRYTQPVTGAVTDIYTKGGDQINTNCIFMLVPDYGVGFNVLVASTLATNPKLRGLIADFIVTQMLPALEAQAAHEAQQNFAGFYKSNTPGLNSSMILALNTSYGVSGLHIESWISNSTDVFRLFRALDGGNTPNVRRLLPLISGSGEVAFRSSVIRPPKLGPVSSEISSDWIDADTQLYGGKAFDRFVFELSEDGTAVSITPDLTGARMEKIV